jgi:membrane protein DedA with SNARE-associated domain
MPDHEERTPGEDPIEQTLDAIETQVDVLRVEAGRRGWFRLEYAILAALGLLFAGYVLAYFALGIDLDALKDWGYLGIFLVAMAGSATIVLPTPSSVAIFGGGIVLDPVLGIPAPLLVGLVAGLGDAIGEFSGYALGYAGTDVIRNQRAYAVFEHWMSRNGTATIFLLSTFPNPLFDLAGAAAGASRMPALRFFLATLGGKIVKDLFLAYGGSFSAGVVRDLV